MIFDFDTEIKRQTGTDGKEYKVCNGTFYSAEALDGAILALEYARVNKIRIRIFYAYKTTEERENGVKDSEFDVLEVWNDEFDCIGRLGRSNGNINIPILLSSSSSCYGSPILDSRTVLVKTTEGKVLFSADGLKFPEWKVNADSDEKTCELLYKTSLMKDFKVYATCRNEDFQKAVRYLGNLSGYMQGVRFTKGGR